MGIWRLNCYDCGMQRLISTQNHHLHLQQGLIMLNECFCCCLMSLGSYSHRLKLFFSIIDDGNPIFLFCLVFFYTGEIGNA